MGRFIASRALLMAFVTAMVAPGTAFGAQPVHVRDHFTDSFTDVVCTIPVEIDITVNVNLLVYADGAIRDLSSFRIVYTNPVNGQSVILSAAGQVDAPTPIVDEQARTLTVVTTYKGLPEQLRSAHGPVLLRDAGIIQFTLVLDLDTLQVISNEIGILRGPHPDAESGFALFCDVLSAALQ